MTLGLNTRTSREPVHAAATEGSAAAYFPIRPENQWIYTFPTREGERRQIVRVEEMQQLRGHDWGVVTYRIEDSREEFTKLLRTEGDLLIQYSFPRTEEIRLIDFGRTEADRSDPSLGFVESREENCSIRGMNFERCVVIGSGYVDHETGIYAPGIGLIESSWLYGRKELLSAVIDGVQIGIDAP